MKTDAIIATQRLMAESIFGLAEHIAQAKGTLLTGVEFSELPSPPEIGMVSCITDSTVNTWGTVIAGGGAFTVLGFYNGTAWTVIAA